MSIIHAAVLTEDTKVIEQVRGFVEAEGHHFTHFSSAAETSQAVHGGRPCDSLIVDASRGKGLGRNSIAELLHAVPAGRITLLLDPGESSYRQQARDCGIDQFLTKPLLTQDVDRWLSTSTSIVDSEVFSSGRLTDSPCRPEPAPCLVEELPNGRFFVAACPAMLDLYKNIRLLAPVDVPVLVLGESGVGKEIVSHLLHKHSNRSQREFTDVNCAALPSELLESELFGYEAGAFTGAHKAKPGKFEIAHKGTLLLDEIGEMSAPMQAKLLHVLQDGHFSRLGARVSSQVDVRVLAATNINMEEAIAERRFREDLYYRLNAFCIRVPALRERREEIPYLLTEMFRRGAEALNREGFEPSDALVTRAQEYHWPGNLRELRNFITRILVLRDEQGAMNELALKLRGNPRESQPQPAMPLPSPVAENMRSVVRGVKDQAEMRLIGDALQATGWNRRRAAENLQISYRALLYKIQQYGLAQQGVRIAPAAIQAGTASGRERQTLFVS